MRSEMTALSLSLPKRRWVKYKLSRDDDEWSEVDGGELERRRSGRRRVKSDFRKRIRNYLNLAIRRGRHQFSSFLVNSADEMAE